MCCIVTWQRSQREVTHTHCKIAFTEIYGYTQAQFFLIHILRVFFFNFPLILLTSYSAFIVRAEYIFGPFFICVCVMGIACFTSQYLYTHLRIEFKNKFIQRNVFVYCFGFQHADAMEYLVLGNPFSAAHGFRHILMLFVCMNDCLVRLANINVSGRRHLILFRQRVLNLRTRLIFSLAILTSYMRQNIFEHI